MMTNGANNPELDALALRLVRGGASAWQDIASKVTELNVPPPPRKRILVDSVDGEQLALRLLKFNTATGATQDDVEKCRRFPQRKWSEREGAWLVPLTDPNLAHLFDSWPESDRELTDAGKLLLDYHLRTNEVADVKLAQRLAYLKDKLVPQVTDYLTATTPYPHQIVAFASARDAEFFALLMEMGTGKTKVVVDVACDRARRKRAADPSAQFKLLVVAPKTVTHNWLLELEKHTTVDVNVERLLGNKMDRFEGLLKLARDKSSPMLVAVINYEGLEVIEDKLKQFGFDLAVLDESIWIKNTDAKRSRAAFRVGESAKSRFILTGLPITKNVLDLYSQFHFLKSGSLGFTSFYAFESYYGEKNFWGGHQSWRKDKLPELQERLVRFSFSVRRAQCVDLPAKQYQVLDVEMIPEQSNAYEQMEADLVVDLERLGSQKLDRAALAALAADGGESDGRFATARIVLVKLLRLAQITSGFLPATNKAVHRFASNPKLAALDELLEEIDSNDKVVVWSRFVEDVEQVTRSLAGHGAVAFYGGLSDKQRERNLERFKSDPACRVFVGQPQSGGFGINLVEANHVVYFSNDFSLGNRAQSEDRCHRIGQTKPVMYTDLAVANSIDTLVLDRIRLKRELADLLVDPARLIATLRAQIGARGAGTRAAMEERRGR